MPNSSGKAWGDQRGAEETVEDPLLARVWCTHTGVGQPNLLWSDRPSTVCDGDRIPFVIFLPDTDAPGALRVAEAIRAAIESSAALEGEAVDLSSVTVGVASFPEHAVDAESLFRAADTAMYSVKRSGKNRVAFAHASGADSR